jgi:hypothetical protein
MESVSKQIRRALYEAAECKLTVYIRMNGGFMKLMSVIVLISTYSPVHCPNTKCLIANQADPETNYHLMVEVVEETKDYYVTHRAWDHAQREWVDMDYKVIDKPRAPMYVTAVACPTLE